MSATHRLKTWPEYFSAVLSGAKRFELRPNDRDFAVGDVLVLQEFAPDATHGNGGTFTGRSADYRVTYVLDRDHWGVIRAGWCVLGIADIDESTPTEDTTDGR